MLTKDEREVIEFIKVIRDSFMDADNIYRFGGCYGFYKILKFVYPEAQAYELDDPDHILTKIGKKFYDVGGEYCGKDMYFDEHCEYEGKELTLLTEQGHYKWDSCNSGRRVEYIINRVNAFYK